MNATNCEACQTFNKSFILCEEHLQSIDNTIKKYFTEETITYKITKNNFFSYLTNDVNDIFKEENGKMDYITKIEVFINNSEAINMSLTFTKGENTVLKVSGSDKEKIIVFYSELIGYLDQEVVVVKTFNLHEFLFNTGAWIIIVLIGNLLYNTIKPIIQYDKDDYTKAIQTTDIIEKLNYMIAKTEYDKLGVKFYLFVIVMVIISVIGIIKYKLTFADYFLFGKEKKIYEHKMSLKNNIIWTIIIGLVISIVGGLIVAVMPISSLF